MKMRLQGLLLIPISLLFNSCDPSHVTPENKPDLRPLSLAETTVSESNGDFAFRLFQNVTKGGDKNTFISPLSVGMALGMVLNGADGSTRDGILKTINFDGLATADVNQGYSDLNTLLSGMDNKVSLSLGNAVWFQNGFTVDSAFLKDVKTFYDGDATAIDFTTPDAKNVINDWIAKHTDNHIQNMVEDTKGVVMMLVNAIYFKGEWVGKFDKSLTKKDNFNLGDGTVIQTDMMHSKGAPVSIYQDEKKALYEIPYGNGQFVMDILMPNQGSLSTLAATTTADSLNRWVTLADSVSTEVVMPKFKMTWKDELKDELSEMGMGVAFTGDALFPKLLAGGGTHISSVMHQSFIEVNEEGSTAAAATTISIVLTATPQPIPKIIIVDRPFIFMIREKHSGVILFIGQLTNPALL